jgi:hypothetical protein
MPDTPTRVLPPLRPYPARKQAPAVLLGNAIRSEVAHIFHALDMLDAANKANANAVSHPVVSRLYAWLHQLLGNVMAYTTCIAVSLLPVATGIDDDDRAECIVICNSINDKAQYVLDSQCYFKKEIPAAERLLVLTSRDTLVLAAVLSALDVVDDQMHAATSLPDELEVLNAILPSPLVTTATTASSATAMSIAGALTQWMTTLDWVNFEQKLGCRPTSNLVAADRRCVRTDRVAFLKLLETDLQKADAVVATGGRISPALAMQLNYLATERVKRSVNAGLSRGDIPECANVLGPHHVAAHAPPGAPFVRAQRDRGDVGRIILETCNVTDHERAQMQPRPTHAHDVRRSRSRDTLRVRAMRSLSFTRKGSSMDKASSVAEQRGIGELEMDALNVRGPWTPVCSNNTRSGFSQWRSDLPDILRAESAEDNCADVARHLRSWVAIPSVMMRPTRHSSKTNDRDRPRDVDSRATRTASQPHFTPGSTLKRALSFKRSSSFRHHAST